LEDSSGLAINLEAASPTLQINGSNELGLANASNYMLKDTSSTLSSGVVITYDSSTVVNNDYELTTKKYVDDAILAATPDNVTIAGVAGEAFAANSTFVVRYAIDGETAGRIYKATNDEDGSAGEYWAIGIVQTDATSISAGDDVTVIKTGEVNLKSADTNVGATDAGKPVFLQKTDGSFGTADPEAGATAGKQFASVVIAQVKSYSATVTDTVIAIESRDIMGIGLA